MMVQKEARTVRELVTYHGKLAAGTPATPPRDGARFQGGAGAPESTEQELNALAERASTPAEDRGLEEYFLTLAKRYTSETNKHVTLSATYRGATIVQASAIHDCLARLARDSAKQTTAAAEMHAGLATIAR
jgi:hypothetical protein